MKWKPNFFVLAFVLGAIVLTLLPFLQRRFLKAARNDGLVATVSARALTRP